MAKKVAAGGVFGHWVGVVWGMSIVGNAARLRRVAEYDMHTVVVMVTLMRGMRVGTNQA